MQDTIIMTNKESQRYEIINNLINNKINGTQASRQLNLSVRQTKRLKAKVNRKGIQGISFFQKPLMLGLKQFGKEMLGAVKNDIINGLTTVK